MGKPSSRLLSAGLALLVILFTCAGFTVALTYAPCYATVCSESYFGLQARIHIAVFYGLLTIVGGTLVLRALSPPITRATSTVLARRRMPLIGRYPTAGGVLLAFCIVATTVATTAIWHAAEERFWRLRTDALNWETVKAELTATGVLGHFADILIGLLVLPVSRNSLLGKLCGIHQPSLLFAHKMIAYLVALAVVAHGAAYVAFLATYNAAMTGSKRRAAFSIDNPFHTMKGLQERSQWYRATLPTGAIGLILILVMLVTALPIVRRRHFNTFYYTHMICAVATFVLVCMHASTNFYFLLPGLILWIIDWGWRLFKGDAGLVNKRSASLTNVGCGWYKITVSANIRQDGWGACELAERHLEPPLQTYFLNFPTVSKLQNHPFTAISAGTQDTGPTFLFRKSAVAGSKRDKSIQNEWTWKLAALADETGAAECGRSVDCRTEGPYDSPSACYETAARIICIVGGTGLTGAYSIALWWLENRSTDRSASFQLFWTIRNRKDADLPEWTDLMEQVKQVDNMKLEVHVSSEAGRMDVDRLVRGTLAENLQTPPKSTWVYSAGPRALLHDVEDVCVKLETGKDGNGDKRPLAHHVSSYER